MESRCGVGGLLGVQEAKGKQVLRLRWSATDQRQLAHRDGGWHDGNGGTVMAEDEDVRRTSFMVFSLRRQWDRPSITKWYSCVGIAV